MNGEVSILVTRGGSDLIYKYQWLNQPINVSVPLAKMYIGAAQSPNWNCADAALLTDTIQTNGGLSITLYDQNDQSLGTAFLTTDSTPVGCADPSPTATLKYDPAISSIQIAKTYYFTWTAGGEAPEATRLDLYPDETISQNWQFSDISTFTARGVFSREFRLPFTDRNQRVFEMIANSNFVDSNNILNSKIDATIFVDDVPLISGFIRVIRVIRKLGTNYDIEVSFYGDTPDLFVLIGQKKLNEIIDLPNKDHTLTQSYIDNQPDDDILYSLIDRGNNNILSGPYSFPSVSGTAPNVVTDVAPKILQQTPALNWAYIFRQIISDAGFTLDESPSSGGNIIINKLQEIWMPWIDVDPFRLPMADYGMRVHVANTLSYTSSNTTNWFSSAAIFNVDFDPTNGWDTIAPNANTWTLPVLGGDYAWRIWATFEWTSNSATTIELYMATAGNVAFAIQQNLVTSINIAANSAGTYYISGVIAAGIVPLTGAYAYFRLESSAGWPQPVTIYAGNPNDYSGTGYELTAISINGFNSLSSWDVDMVANAPDALQADFLRDAVQMFNLAIIPDPIIPKKVKFVPMVNYLGSDGIDNWTSKLAYDKDIVLRTPIDYLKRKLNFTYSAGGDKASQFFDKNFKRVYGDYKIDGYVINPSDTPNPYATGETTIKLTTQSTPCEYYPSTDRILPRFIDNDTDKKYVPPKMRALYYAGSYTNADGSSYRVLNHYSSYSPNITDFDLNWAPETPLHAIIANPFNNLFTQYWREFLDSLYDSQGRIMEAFFALEFNDIKLFSFGKYYWIEDSYWRVLEIKDYKIGLKELSKVVLMKVVNPQLNCFLTPSGVAVDGSITWIDLNNDPVAGNSECCLSYGYKWNILKEKCFDLVPVNGGGSGGSTSDLIDQVRFTGASFSPPSNSLGAIKNSSVDPMNQFQLVIGENISIASNNNYEKVVGKDIIVQDGAKYSDVSGSNALVTRTGKHFAGGKRLGLGDYGAMQSGMIILSNATIFNSSGSTIELVFGLDVLTRLYLEDDTHWMITIDLSASDMSGMWICSKYTAVIWNKGGTIGASNPIQIMIDDSSGVGQFDLKPSINVIASAPEFRIYAQLNDIGGTPYSFPTPALTIVATINYNQIR